MTPQNRLGNGDSTRAARDYRRGLVALPTADDVARVAQAFWPLVDRSANCWRWAGPLTRDGYGRFRLPPLDVRYRIPTAHRAAWWLDRLRPLPWRWCVCHHCDNPECVRPGHLFLATAADNRRDFCRKVRLGLLHAPYYRRLSAHATS